MYPEALSNMILFFSGVVGAMVGSFLNVCIYRLPKEHLSIVAPRSHCPSCGKMIAWYDNIPIISWSCLGGSCRACRSPIGVRYTLVEILTGVLFIIFTLKIVIYPFYPVFPMEVDSSFALMTESHRWVSLLIALFFVGMMVVVTFIDFDYRIIPNGLNYMGIVLAPIVSTLFPYLHRRIPVEIVSDVHLAGFLASVLGIIVGGGVIYAVRVFGKVIFQKEAMGLGDVKLMAFVGGFLGWDAVLLIFFIGCLLGAIFGVMIKVITKDSYIPFGPYLSAGTLLVLWGKNEIFYFLFDIWPEIASKWLFPYLYQMS